MLEQAETGARSSATLRTFTRYAVVPDAAMLREAAAANKAAPEGLQQLIDHVAA